MSRRTPFLALLALVALSVAAQLLMRFLQPAPAPLPPTYFVGAPALVDPRAPVDGPADATVTIILFSDYACPACRAMHPDLQALKARDPDLRIVYRDWPIFGDASRRAARLAIASARQGRHAAFDDALMRGRIDEAGLRAAAQASGVDWPRLEADVAAHGAEIDALLADTKMHARAMQFPGTPMLLVGPLLVAGRVSAARLDELVGEARAAK